MSELLLAPCAWGSIKLLMFGRVVRSWERRGWRRLVWIARKANTEPVEGFIALAMVLGAWALLTRNNSADAPLLFPRIWGWALLTLGICGFTGLWTHRAGPRLVFSFGGLFVRVWMSLLYFMRDWQDPAWLSFATSSLALAWISVRVVCDTTARQTQKRCG